MKQKLYLVFGAIFMFTSTIGLGVVPQAAQADVSTIRSIIFPAVGKVSYTDDFGAPRSGGRTHEGNDIIGKKLTPLVAAVDGKVTFLVWPEASYGYMLTITDADGFRYNYLHINNDTPGTDDGKADGQYVYAPGIEQGTKVKKGQLVAYMGDSGNAESTVSHLHFEIRTSDDTPINPYLSLQQSTKINAPLAGGQQDDELVPYGEFMGGASIATANIDKDSTKEIIVGAGPGGGPHVRRFESIPTSPTKNTDIKGDFFAYSSAFTGGIDVAAADTTGDGKAEIITAPGAGGGPHIKVFKADGTLLNEFFAYSSKFTGGVNVAAADLDGDGKAEIITAPKGNSIAIIKVFKADGTLLKEFTAYDSSFLGGADVSAMPMEGKKAGLIVTAPGPGGGPHIKTFSSTGEEVSNFFAYDKSFTGGVRVSVGKVGSSYKIGTAPASGGGADFKMFSITGTSAKSYSAFEKWWTGGYDIAIGSSLPIISTSAGNRRATVRAVKSSSSVRDSCTSSRCRSANSY